MSHLTAPLRTRPSLLLPLLLALGAAPLVGDVANLTLSDQPTGVGSVGPGTHEATHASDDVTEVLTEMQTSGKPTARLSMLEHGWTLDVAPGHNYRFELEAWRTPNAEGDDFAFSYSLDGDAWLPLVTVAKGVDDGAAQTFVFPMDVAGPMQIRVEDTDRTPGHRVQDVLRIDRLAVVTDLTTADETPPPPLAGLDAHSGDGVVELTWPVSTSSDAVGYRLERAVGDGAFLPLGPAVVGRPPYVDSAVTNMTLYRYRARTVDAASNASAASAEALAVPHQGDGPVFVRVASVDVSLNSISGGWKAARARVRLVDELGGPVAGATVRVTFGGLFHETLTGTSGADGVALIQTNQAEKGKLSVSACVIDVTHPQVYYLPQGNSQTCTGP